MCASSFYRGKPAWGLSHDGCASCVPIIRAFTVAVRARPYALSMRQGLVDILGLLGFAAFIYGLWLMYQPLAWVVGGLLALGYALQSSRASTSVPDAP